MGTSRKRHHSSFGSVTRLPSGRFPARYTGPDGLRRTAGATFDTKTAAQDWLAGVRTDLVRHQWSAAERGDVPLKTYLADWLDSAAHLRPSTLTAYRGVAERWLLTPHGAVALGDVALSAITPDLVRRWYAGLCRDTHAAAVERARSRSRNSDTEAARAWARERGMPVKATGRLPDRVLDCWRRAGRPASSDVADVPADAGRVIAVHAYRLLRAVLNTALGDGVIVANPCRLPGAGSSDAAERQPASADEVAGLARAMPPRYQAAVLVAAWSGLRPGELFALRRADVSIDGTCLHVDRTMVELPGSGVGFGPPKSQAGRRTLHLPPGVARALVQHLEVFVADDREALVFTTEAGRPVDKSRRSTLMRRARQAVEREDLTWHHLRHTGMTLAAATGAPLAQLQRRLGHSTVRASLIYQHASDDADRLLAERLDSLVSASGGVVLPFARPESA